MAKKGSLSGTFSTVTDFLSPEAQAQLREKAGILSPLPLAIDPGPTRASRDNCCRAIWPRRCRAAR